MLYSFSQLLCVQTRILHIVAESVNVEQLSNNESYRYNSWSSLCVTIMYIKSQFDYYNSHI